MANKDDPSSTNKSQLRVVDDGQIQSVAKSLRESTNGTIVDQGAKKIIFTACHAGKLKLAFTSPDIISTSPKSFLTSRIDFTVLLLFEFLKKHHLPVGQVKNRIH